MSEVLFSGSFLLGSGCWTLSRLTFPTLIRRSHHILAREKVVLCAVLEAGDKQEHIVTTTSPGRTARHGPPPRRRVSTRAAAQQRVLHSEVRFIISF